MKTLRATCLLLAAAALCSACVSTYHEPKPDISAINTDLIRAANGDASSQHQLALAFGGQGWNRRGVGVDAAASQRYLIAAAEQNNVTAQVELGRRYFNGAIGTVNPGAKTAPALVEKDYDAALYWLNRAARQFSPEAYGELRAVYDRPGTPLFNVVEACKWAILQYPATKYCEQKKLTDEQMAKARRSAGDWLSQR
jgi:TPR repeat protein